jgi:hypothetical protein
LRRPKRRESHDARRSIALAPRLLKLTRMTRATLLITLLASTGCVAPQGDRAVGNLTEAAMVCAAGATVTGIDVSHYQGTVDWAKVAASGRKFGIAKATEGTGYTDSSCAAHRAAV